MNHFAEQLKTLTESLEDYRKANQKLYQAALEHDVTLVEKIAGLRKTHPELYESIVKFNPATVCGCGRPTRYMVTRDDGEPTFSCNKLTRCEFEVTNYSFSTYREIEKDLTIKISFLEIIQLLLNKADLTESDLEVVSKAFDVGVNFTHRTKITLSPSGKTNNSGFSGAFEKDARTKITEHLEKLIAYCEFVKKFFPEKYPLVKENDG